MISKGKSKTAAEKDWLSQVVGFARNTRWLAETYGFNVYCYDFEIHHIKGAQYKLKINNETVKVGELFILPVPRLLHSVSIPEAENHPYNVTRRKKAFEDKYGKQADLWRSMLDAMVLEGYELPFDNDLIEAVMR